MAEETQPITLGNSATLPWFQSRTLGKNPIWTEIFKKKKLNWKNMVGYSLAPIHNVFGYSVFIHRKKAHY
jgi:hypothetical protein